jgi:hypothetical protein
MPAPLARPLASSPEAHPLNPSHPIQRNLPLTNYVKTSAK